MRILVLALIALGLSTTHAEAGACLEDSEHDELVRLIEKRVQKPDTDLDYLDNCFYSVTEGPFATKKRLARINAACTKILTKNPADEDCIELAALQRMQELAGVKLYDAVIAWKSTPWSGHPTLTLLQRIGDPRTAALVVERWTAAIPEATRREKRRDNSNMIWSSWRQDAARVLGALGTADQIPFLEEQAKATKDRYVKKACTDAIAAIQKRATP